MIPPGGPLRLDVAVAEPPPAHPLEPELPFEPGEIPPRPIVWLQPWELLRTACRSLISTVATGFLDRRETLASLEGPRESPVHSLPGVLRPAAQRHILELAEPHGDLWIDYIADIGDSWDATYATTTLLAQNALRVRGLEDKLPGGDILAIGGDLVYPWPSRDGYRARTRSAFLAALPRQPERRPSMVAIPGNHDWYDGLTSFVREFCQGGAIGGWRVDQRRSYFAARLSETWWLWGIDIALDARIDSPQQAYFLNVLLHQRDVRSHEHYEEIKWDADNNPLMNVILCTAKPVWLDHPRHTTDAYNNLAYFTDLVRHHGAAIPVILAGDTHHYSRFEDSRGQQMIVCGGGGAYIAGTHQVPLQVDRVTGRRSHRPRREQHKKVNKPKRLHPANQPPAGGADDRRYRASDHCYPSREESKRLAYGALLLIRRSENWPFLMFVGVMAALFAWTPEHAVSRLMGGSFAEFGLRLRDALTDPLPRRAWLSAFAVYVICVSYAATASSHGSRLLRIAWGAFHGTTQLLLALWVYALFAWPRLPLTMASFSAWLPESFAYVPVAWCVRLLVYIVVAGAVGTTWLGVYLVLSDRIFGWHSDEVFSFQGIYDYRSFLRMKLAADGSLTIYPIGLQRVPRRWRARAESPRASAGMDEAKPGLYEPGDAVLLPHSIEAPVTVRPQPWI